MPWFKDAELFHSVFLFQGICGFTVTGPHTQHLMTRQPKHNKTKQRRWGYFRLRQPGINFGFRFYLPAIVLIKKKKKKINTFICLWYRHKTPKHWNNLKCLFDSVWSNQSWYFYLIRQNDKIVKHFLSNLWGLEPLCSKRGLDDLDHVLYEPQQVRTACWRLILCYAVQLGSYFGLKNAQFIRCFFFYLSFEKSNANAEVLDSQTKKKFRKPKQQDIQTRHMFACDADTQQFCSRISPCVRARELLIKA